MYVSYWLFIYIKFCFFFKTLIQYQFCLLPLHTDVAPVVSDNGTSSFFCWITTVIQLRHCIFDINLFITITFLPEHNLYMFCCYNIKEGKFVFVLEQNLFLGFHWFYFLIYLNSLYESYSPLSSLFLILFFNYLIQNQLSTATATIIGPVVSDNGKFTKTFFRIHYSNFLIIINSLHESYLQLSTLFII